MKNPDQGTSGFRRRLVDEIKAGDRVTTVNRFGKQHTGRAVMRSSHGGWVLNMGGPHGTPGLADDSNIVKVSPGRQKNPLGKKSIEGGAFTLAADYARGAKDAKKGISEEDAIKKAGKGNYREAYFRGYLEHRPHIKKNPITGKAITTRYVGATNTKPSRIIATAEPNHRVTVTYQSYESGEKAHEDAAQKLADKMGWTGKLIGGGTKTGYVFVFAPDKQRPYSVLAKKNPKKRRHRKVHLVGAKKLANPSITKINYWIVYGQLTSPGPGAFHKYYFTGFYDKLNDNKNIAARFIFEENAKNLAKVLSNSQKHRGLEFGVLSVTK